MSYSYFLPEEQPTGGTQYSVSAQASSAQTSRTAISTAAVRPASASQVTRTAISTAAVKLASASQVARNAISTAAKKPASASQVTAMTKQASSSPYRANAAQTSSTGRSTAAQRQASASQATAIIRQILSSSYRASAGQISSTGRSTTARRQASGSQTSATQRGSSLIRQASGSAIATLRPQTGPRYLASAGTSTSRKIGISASRLASSAVSATAGKAGTRTASAAASALSSVAKAAGLFRQGNAATAASILYQRGKLLLAAYSRASPGTFLDDAGAMENAGANIPRFDHSPLAGHASLGLMLEPASTNMYGQNVAMPNFFSATNCTVAKSTDVAPIYAGATVWKSTRTVAGGDNNSGYPGNVIGTASTVYTGSAWLWIPSSFTGTSINLALDGSSSIQANPGANMSLRDQWQRVYITATTGASQTSFALLFRPSSNVGDVFYSCLWQCEPGSSLTSTILTTSGAATRAADIPGPVFPASLVKRQAHAAISSVSALASAGRIFASQRRAVASVTAALVKRALLPKQAAASTIASIAHPIGKLLLAAYARPSPATYTDQNGVIQTAPSNTLRFDHSPSYPFQDLGPLMEAATTNLVRSSTPSSAGGWSASGTLTVNAGSAPDGSNTATQYVENTAASGSGLSIVSPGFSATTGLPYTRSIFCKASASGSKRYPVIFFQNPAFTNYGSAIFDVVLGTVVSASSGITASIKAFPGGWFRCSATGTTIATTASASNPIRVTASSSDPYANQAGDGVSGLLFWGCQVEQQPSATSLVQTTGTVASRAADTGPIFYGSTSRSVGKISIAIGGTTAIAARIYAVLRQASAAPSAFVQRSYAITKAGLASTAAFQRIIVSLARGAAAATASSVSRARPLPVMQAVSSLLGSLVTLRTFAQAISSAVAAVAAIAKPMQKLAQAVGSVSPTIYKFKTAVSQAAASVVASAYRTPTPAAFIARAVITAFVSRGQSVRLAGQALGTSLSSRSTGIVRVSVSLVAASFSRVPGVVRIAASPALATIRRAVAKNSVQASATIIAVATRSASKSVRVAVVSAATLLQTRFFRPTFVATGAVVSRLSISTARKISASASSAAMLIRLTLKISAAASIVNAVSVKVAGIARGASAAAAGSLSGGRSIAAHALTMASASVVNSVRHGILAVARSVSTTSSTTGKAAAATSFVLAVGTRQAGKVIAGLASASAGVFRGTGKIVSSVAAVYASAAAVKGREVIGQALSAAYATLHRSAGIAKRASLAVSATAVKAPGMPLTASASVVATFARGAMVSLRLIASAGVVAFFDRLIRSFYRVSTDRIVSVAPLSRDMAARAWDRIASIPPASRYVASEAWDRLSSAAPLRRLVRAKLPPSE